jgi:hypothetical protein
MRSKPAIGVIDAEMQPELRPRGEHAIRLVGPFRDQVVDQDAGVCLGPVESKWGLALYSQRCVDPRHQALAGSLFIAAGTVDLSC